MRCSAALSLSVSAFVFGWTAAAYAGCGKVDTASSRMPESFVVNVSPVAVSCSLAMAPMSPEGHALGGLLLLAAHRHDLPDALVPAVLSVPDVRVRAEGALVHPEEVQAAEIRIGDRLEDQRRQRAIGASPAGSRHRPGSWA